jgi:hypothetical protein
MHIASALTVVRREQVQTGLPMSRGRRPRAQKPAAGTVGWRKMIPGAILLTVLVLLGGLFPSLF